MKQYIQGLPKQDKNISIRGELIISKEDFDKYLKDDFKNPRNGTTGIVNAKKTNEK